MPLRKLAVPNYRCFPDRQQLEIFPVTVVLGKNNSHKSALVRTPLVFATGFGL
jgi:AAA15 family ATPase/GTPase